MRGTCRGRRQKAGRGREREAERARRRLRNRIEDERPGALTRPRRRIARFTVAAGERKAASRSELLPEMEKADAHRSIDPLSAKTGSGEQRAHVTPSLDAEFRPCMPVGERADRRVTWNRDLPVERYSCAARGFRDLRVRFGRHLTANLELVRTSFVPWLPAHPPAVPGPRETLVETCCVDLWRSASRLGVRSTRLRGRDVPRPVRGTVRHIAAATVPR